MALCIKDALSGFPLLPQAVFLHRLGMYNIAGSLGHQIVPLATYQYVVHMRRNMHYNCQKEKLKRITINNNVGLEYALPTVGLATAPHSG